MSSTGIFLVLLLGILVILGFYLITTYNRLVALRNSANTAWSQIDTELQQRLDLIPALVTTVKGYAAHERQTLQEVIEARAGAISSKNPEELLAKNDALTSTLSKLMLLAEAYPNLKADQSFLDLQSQLANIERRINMARRFYNESVLVYNTAQQQFPANLVAKPFGHVSSDLYKAKTEAAEPPKFEF